MMIPRVLIAIAFAMFFHSMGTLYGESKALREVNFLQTRLNQCGEKVKELLNDL